MTRAAFPALVASVAGVWRHGARIAGALLLAVSITGGVLTHATNASAVHQRIGFMQLARDCAPKVDPYTLSALVRTESGFNPFAIGVVGAHLERQPASLAEALATVRELELLGYSYSVGLAQVNNRNFAKYGETAATLFEPCRNLHAGAEILSECFGRSSQASLDQQAALRAALSCYYSGNFTSGFSTGYVRRVLVNARRDALRGGIEPIPVTRDVKDPARADRPYPAGQSATQSATVHVMSSLAPPPFKPVSDVNNDVKRSAPSCHAHPLVTVCRGLSAAQIRGLCVRCLDSH
ncbi:lytic transglycosylase domain-containing protein [Paraburkholderia nemoris]|uniref:lytic transglycosylase domain-containing protein n=1 Tax=Paraburkholderia nemoris TaxID=2793076 RepID=UPI0038B761C2